jgi:hypothetical protein
VTSSGQGDIVPFDCAKELQDKGYRTETPEQIIQATKSQSYYVRSVAIELLTQRIGKEAIPVLRQALNDPRFEVRFDAAHLLGTLGDKSGLDRMRQDLKEFAPDNGAPLPPDPNVLDPNEIKERENKRNLRLYYALQAARVLAELGDLRGYELAARMALGGAWEAQRQESIHVLVEICMTEPGTLTAEGGNPVSVLSAMAESEKSKPVFTTLISSVQKLNPDMASRVLEKAVSSPHQSEKMRNVVKLGLWKVKAK